MMPSQHIDGTQGSDGLVVKTSTEISEAHGRHTTIVIPPLHPLNSFLTTGARRGDVPLFVHIPLVYTIFTDCMVCLLLAICPVGYPSPLFRSWNRRSMHRVSSRRHLMKTRWSTRTIRLSECWPNVSLNSYLITLSRHSLAPRFPRRSRLYITYAFLFWSEIMSHIAHTLFPQFIGLEAAGVYKQQVSVLRTKGGVPQQPTKGDLALHAAKQMKRHMVGFHSIPLASHLYP